jgi:hypothetical protein
MFQLEDYCLVGLMRIINSLLAPSLFIVAAGIAFSFYSVTYYPHYDYDRKILPYHIQDFFVLRPVVIYPERAFGVSARVISSLSISLNGEERALYPLFSFHAALGWSRIEKGLWNARSKPENNEKKGIVRVISPTKPSLL